VKRSERMRIKMKKVRGKRAETGCGWVVSGRDGLGKLEDGGGWDEMDGWYGAGGREGRGSKVRYLGT